MHLYQRFKINFLETSQGRYPMDIFLGRFKDVRKTFLQNFINKQRLTFKYFTQHIQRVGSKGIQQMCFVLCLKLTSWGRPKHVTMQASLQDAIRTPLGRLSEIYETLGMTQLFLRPDGTLKLCFKNIVVINLIDCVKLTFSERLQNIIMWTSPRKIFHTSFGRLPKTLSKYRSCFSYFLLHAYVQIYMSTYSQY